MNHEPSAGMPSFFAVRPPALRCAQARLLDVIYCVAGGAYHLVSGAGILIRLVRGLLAGASAEAAGDGQQPGAGSWRAGWAACRHDQDALAGFVPGQATRG